jgi:hypothetical protein
VVQAHEGPMTIGNTAFPLGLSFKDFRDLIRAIRNTHPLIDQFATQEILDIVEPLIGEKSLLQFWNEFAPRYLEKDEHQPQLWCLTDEAISLGTKRLRRISAATLERLKATVIERARNSSQQTVSPLEVGQLIFFGSAIGPSKPDYGDLDVAIRTMYQKRYGNYDGSIKQKPEWRALSYYPQEALYKYIKGGSAYVHITSEFDFDHLKMVGEVVYQSPDWEDRKKA